MPSQTKYAKESIDLAQQTDGKPVDIPMKVRFHKDFGDPISDPNLYPKLVGTLYI